MKTKNIAAAGFALTVLVLAPLVIGRYHNALAGFFSLETLTGLGVVATLVALVTKEYRVNPARRGFATGGRVAAPATVIAPSKVVPMWRNDDRASARAA